MSMVHDVFNNPGVRGFLLATRKILALVIFLGVLYVVPQGPWFWVGVAVSLLGAAGQWWCFACIMTSKELAHNGPYRFVRNPMYLTRFFLILGAMIALAPVAPPWGIVVLVAYIVLYWFYMSQRVAREERKLSKLFGPEYQEFLKTVPRFLPSLTPKAAGKTWFWNPEAFRRNNGALNAVWVVVGLIAAYALVYHLFPALRELLQG